VGITVSESKKYSGSPSFTISQADTNLFTIKLQAANTIQKFMETATHENQSFNRFEV
jgi:hypothetical protein